MGGCLWVSACNAVCKHSAGTYNLSARKHAVPLVYHNAVNSGQYVLYCLCSPVSLVYNNAVNSG